MAPEAPLPVLVIRLDAPDGECAICGVYLPVVERGVPLYEDLVLPNDWTGEWAGFDACLACFEAQGKLAVPVLRWEFLESLKGA